MYIKKAYNSVSRDVLNNILTKLYIPMKLIRLMEVCLN